jgi:hypothetical protein
MAGYSKRTLIDKLGIKSGHKLILIGAPAGYNQTLGVLPQDVTQAKALRGEFDVIHYFTTSRTDFERKFPALKEHLHKQGMLWISWPKGASKLKTDLNENIIREIGLANGLVDVKVAAIDDDWSGLKFVYRLKDR